MTNQIYLPVSSLTHGSYYHGHCRNASVARWHEPNQLFYHWRTKFAAHFIEAIEHCDLERGPRFDVFYPYEEITYSTPEIPFPKETPCSPSKAITTTGSTGTSAPTCTSPTVPSSSSKPTDTN